MKSSVRDLMCALNHCHILKMEERKNVHEIYIMAGEQTMKETTRSQQNGKQSN